MKIDPVNEQRSASLFLMAGAERPLVPYVPQTFSVPKWKEQQ